MEKLQDIELKIKDIQKDGVFAISLVESPAIEEDFVYLNSHEIELKVVDEEKRIVVGYALIPDKKILRVVNGKQFNIFFTAETVRQSAELYMSNLKQNSVTVNHEKSVDDVGVIESWITEDSKHDKINLYGIKPIVGGWAIMMKVNNDKEWDAVKRGEYKGFSIEARYDGFEQLKQNKMSEVEKIKQIIADGLKLESQEVKLALIDDVENESKKMTNLFTKLTSTISEYNEKGKLMRSLADKIAQESVSSLKVMSNYESQVKDLGFTLPSKFVIQKKSVENLQKMTDKLRIKPIEISTNPGSY